MADQPSKSTSGGARSSGESPAPSSSAENLPSVTLPKGGGGIRGIGEKFASNPVTGTGSMSIPITTSPGRSNFGPRLSLSYDSGAGNGPFGFGWSLSLPSISRKTDKGLPQYQDPEESDVFVVSGVEDLVQVLGPDDTTTAPGYRIRRYRPRIEGAFARIERWTSDTIQAGDPRWPDISWRSISRDNVLTLYGTDSASRIHDPADASRIFSWLITETRDDKGNAVVYDYKPEDGNGADLAAAHERNRGNRDDPRRKANRYLKRIRYGNRVPLLDDVTGSRPRFLSAAQIRDARWMFELVVDYGEHRADTPTPGDAGEWTPRRDPFSTYRSGFEVRTTRLCQRLLMFHHFPSEMDVRTDCLVRSTDFTYSNEQDPDDARNPVYSFLRAVTQTGYRRSGDGYARRSLPPVEFEYSQPQVQDAVEEIDSASLENLPIGVDGVTFQWTDLHGEGIAGILTEQAGAWYYKRNLSPIGRNTRRVEFGALEQVAAKPNLSLAGGRALFMDLAGDGQPDLVALGGPMAGLYAHDEAEGWQPFRPFTSWLNRDVRGPNLRFVDLDGDGRADVLITEDDALVWHASLAEAGFGPARRLIKALDEETGPRVVFDDGTHSIYLADLSGDGLTDLVRINNREVCYWPNLGYGRFGPKVTMDHAPHFDHPDQFDSRRIRLADIDGSGTTDIIYLHAEGIRLYFNQSGNSWSNPHALPFPRVDDVVSILPTDLLGNGTACLVWSSPLPSDARAPMRYLNLMGRQKPHLLVKTVNNLGAETRVQYAPSTRFYLQDNRDGKPWITRLPFPVHLVERVETFDHISRNRFVTRYAYHDGYFDAEEREFRGFGMVEEWDTEELAALTGDGSLPVPTNADAVSHVPPVHTKTWFHTGLYLSRDLVSNYLAQSYYREPTLSDDQARAALLPDTEMPMVLPPLSLEEEREACRALKGSMLRQEVYALDGTSKQQHPYTVTEQHFTVRVVQRRGENHHAVFFTHPRESLSYHYERSLAPVLNAQIVDDATADANPQVEWQADPRVAHALTLEVDNFGNVLRSASVGYGRRYSDLRLPSQPDRDRQTQVLVTSSENRFTTSHDTGAEAIDSTDDYRAPVPSESRTYELTGLTLPAGRVRFTFAEVNKASADATPLDYEEVPAAGLRKRLIEHARTYYRRDDLTGPLPLGELQALALPFESYKLAFTPGLLADVYAGRVSDAMIEAGGRYVHTEGDGNWWIPSGRVFYSPGAADTPPQELAYARQHFFLPHRFRDPFHTNLVGTESFVRYDAHHLLAIETSDPIGNRVTVGERLANGAIDTAKPGNDYRVLQPRLMTDQNRNRAQVAFDALGMVVGMAVMGKREEDLGDSLDEFVPDLTDPVALAHLGNPLAAPHAVLDRASTRLIYDLFAYQRSKDQPDPQPAVIYSMARETHDADLKPGDQVRIQHTFSYSDGFGREIQRKVQAEPGPVVAGGPDVSPRWVGIGWTIFNNKGKAVRQYEPFFSHLPPGEGHRFEFGVQVGVSPILFYDPLDRVVATLHPNHTYEKVIFDAWQQTTYDANDTVFPRNAQTSDPRTDLDIRGYVEHYFAAQPADPTQPWETWHQQRQAGLLGERERIAASKAAAHADTPTTVYFDALGRPFLTLARNRLVCVDHPLDNTEDQFATRVDLDIEGNQRAVRDAVVQAGDAQGRVVMRYAYDMLGNRVYQVSMEAGARWTLNDVDGKPIHAWDSRGHHFHTEYDPLRRPVRSFVTGADPADLSRVLLTELLVYGEQHPEDELRNLRGKLYLHLDQAGAVTNEAYDFKGNLLSASRRIAVEYKTAIDWSTVSAALPVGAAAQLNPAALEAAVTPFVEADTYNGRTTLDALSRPITITTPHTQTMQPSVIRLGYNEDNLIERVDACLRGAAANGQPVWTPFVVNIDYDAKGQRERIDFGNGVATTYEYDPSTYRLVRLLTLRNTVTFRGDSPRPPLAGWPGRGVQNLRYTYDPVGNITHIQDDAQQAIYFKNQRVEPSADYTYDAVYRLIEATGREHLGQGGVPIPHSFNDALRSRLPHPGDGNAMGTYIERYVYDAVDNFLEMRHRGSVLSGWARTYAYGETSQIEDGTPGTRTVRKTSNRLSSTTIGDSTERYVYDAHGNIVRMPHLGGGYPAPNMQWDHHDHLRQVDLGAGGTAYYTYDSAGQRVRKVWEKSANLVEERIYLGGFEIYRRRQGAERLERETLHVMDDKQRIALVETRTLDPAGDDPAPAQLTRYQFGNHLGSASLELDGQARIVSYEEYTPYGSTSYQAVRNLTETPKRYRHTGKERDEETGMYYYGARYYPAWLGRWSSSDPAGLADGPNLFAYAHSSPTTVVDHDGLAGEPPERKINDVVRYGEDMKGRVSGVRPEKDHIISQGKQRLINPKVKTSNQLTVLQETGAAKGGAPAKPHTQVTFHDPQADKKEIKRLRGVKPENWTSFEQEIVSPSLESRYRAGYSPSSTNIAALDEIGSMFEISQPNRAPKSSPDLDWSKRTAPVGPPVDSASGRVVTAGEQTLETGGKAMKQIGAEALQKSSKAAGVLASLGKAGRHFAAAIPIAGIVIGQASAAHAASQGDYVGAALDEAGFIPIAGDLLDAARGGVAVGEALDSGLGVSNVAAEHGERFEKAARSLGRSEDTSRIIGAGGAALSALTSAPAIALKRTVFGWFN